MDEDTLKFLAVDLIAATLPGTVAKCYSSCHDKTSTSVKNNDLAAYMYSLREQIYKDCGVKFDRKLSKHDTSNPTQDILNELKTALEDVYAVLRADILEEVRDSVKSELRMELFLELEKLKKANGKPLNSLVKNEDKSSDFNFAIDFKDAIDSKKRNSKKANDPCDLEHNKLYQMVSRSLEKSKNEALSYTENVSEARENSLNSDEKYVSARVENPVSYQSEPDESAENELLWNGAASKKYKNS